MMMMKMMKNGCKEKGQGARVQVQKRNAFVVLYQNQFGDINRPN